MPAEIAPTRPLADLSARATWLALFTLPRPTNWRAGGGLIHDLNFTDARLRDQSLGQGTDTFTDIKGDDKDDGRKHNPDGDVPFFEVPSQAQIFVEPPHHPAEFT